jgi:putative aminopeptidase FrvX
MLEQLINTFGPSGYESGVAELVRRELKTEPPDHIGNRTVHTVGTKRSKIAIAVAMDTPGFVVTSKDKSSGRLKVAKVGNLNVTPPHRMRFWDNTIGIYLEDNSIDIRENAVIDVGDMAIPDEPYFTIDTRFSGFGAGVRSTVSILIDILKTYDSTLTGLFTTMSEVGGRGLNIALGESDFDTILYIGMSSEAELGSGPALNLLDISPNVLNKFKSFADTLPFQPDVTQSPITKIMAKYVSQSAYIAIPVRGLKSPIETVDSTDIEKVEKLILAYLNS